MEIKRLKSEEIKAKIKTILRWAAVLPTFPLIYVLVKIITDFSSNYYLSPDLVEKLVHSQDVSGIFNYFYGSLYLFSRELGSFSLALLLSVMIAPKHHKPVYFFLIGLWVLVLLISAYGIGISSETYYWTTWLIWKTVLETAAQVFAVVFVGMEVFKEANTANTNNTNVEAIRGL